METFSFDVPLLDPAGDFPGPRALSSFFTVEGKGGVRNREVGGVEGGDQARPATMTSRAFKDGSDRRR